MMADIARVSDVLVQKVRRNWHWGRTHGWANLIEEHDLDPRVRLPRAARQVRWSLRHSLPPGNARAVFLVGAQRSGTNMIAHGLDQAPEVEVFNEGNRRAFSRFQLREPEVVDALVAQSRRPFVLFKPLCDADRTAELLDRERGGRPARAIWAFRDARGRARSHVQKFGTSNLDAFREFVRGTADVGWQLRGVSPENLELIRSFGVETMSAHSASALFWYVRNAQFFELGLDRRDDVMLADYGAFLSDPERAMRGLCTFLGFPYRSGLVAHIAPQVRTPLTTVDVDDRILALCAPLEERLRAAYVAQGERADVDPLPQGVAAAVHGDAGGEP